MYIFKVILVFFGRFSCIFVLVTFIATIFIIFAFLRFTSIYGCIYLGLIVIIMSRLYFKSITFINIKWNYNIFSAS